ncbi:hypothetical protein Poli38472_009771 [Pythium oligandrum]|uniref:Uncharacterized protein n=1 Tax=Pythium oligandrum TaxID=41045 RepID=A0A8K1FL30_PYTOL|nr:hypothetical protein Poli38472_009771 [Pythium oligandrum]|eukprot:TMW62278.1 hypothetical protein Poli38472_009771 [Pythium oligandrum]
MSRHRQRWQAFVQRTLRFDAYEDLYAGVCFIDNADRVEYSQGCFTRDEIMLGATQVTFDSTQFRLAFDQLTRLAVFNNTNSSMQAVDVFQFGSLRFQVVHASFTSMCAVTAGRRLGLIVERFSYGILVVAFQAPHALEQLFPIVQRCCAAVR